MNTREIAAEYRLTHWAQIMKDRVASGMNIKEYCKASGLNENVYFYWQRKLREAAGNGTIPVLLNAVNANNQPTPPPGWALCKATEIKSTKNELHIEIGVSRVTISEDVDPELLSKVCRVLVGIC